MSYTLYGFPGSASFGPQALMADAGLDFTAVSVDISDGSTHTPEYLAINPGGYVPALVLDDGRIMCEAAAIMLYLADFHGLGDLVPDVDDPNRAPLLRTLFYLSSTVQECYKHYYYPTRFTTNEGDAPNVQQRAIELAMERWQPVEDQLSGSGPYALGNRFSLVDIYVAMLASWHPDPDAFYVQFPAIKKCRDLVVARPGIAPVAAEHEV